jgi:transposase-like protein
LSTERMKNWMATDLSGLDLLVVQIDGIHITEHLVLVAAVGIDGEGIKHPLGLVEGATENAVVVQALIDNLVVRGLDPTRPRLFIIDGSKALCKAIRRTFGRHTPIQRCQIHKARNIMGRLAPALHASVRRVLRLKERARGQELQTATTDDANESRQDRRLHFDGALACFAPTGHTYLVGDTQLYSPSPQPGGI